MSQLTDKSWTPAAVALATAGRDVARGAGMFGRGAIGLIGMSTLAAALLLLGNEQMRERVIAAAVSNTGLVTAGSSSVDDDLRAEDEASGQGRSNWLAAPPAGAVEPAQEQVTRYLSRRYRVAENAVRQIVGQAFTTGRSLGLDPLLILAVTAIESNLNPFAQSPLGAQGLMQIMTHVHSEKFAAHGGDHAALDPIANLKVGSEILRDLIRRGGSVERGLQLYVGAGNLPDDGGYATRVLGEMARIKLAASGSVRDALAVGLTSDATAAPGATTVPVGGLLQGSMAPSDSPADRQQI